MHNGTKIFKNFLSLLYSFNRWAVSTVMTRQNLIPSQEEIVEGDGKEKQLVPLVNALIPLWDFCNHQDGQVKVNASFTKSSKFSVRFSFADWLFRCFNCDSFRRISIPRVGEQCAKQDAISGLESRSLYFMEQGLVRSSSSITAL